MAIDASIYQNLKTPSMDLNASLEGVKNLASLSTIGMQQQQMQMQFAQQQAMRQAYAQNTDASGNVDQSGAISSLGKMGYGHLVPGMSAELAKQQKEQADAQAAQMQAMRSKMDVGLPKFEDLLINVPADQRATVYPNYMAQLKAQGVDFSKVLPVQYDEDAVKNFYAQSLHQKEYLDKQLTTAQTKKTQDEAGEIPYSIAEKQAQTGKALAEKKKIESETYARPETAYGQADDPAKLVPFQVPKDHQAKVFEEIKNAQDVNRLAPQIMDAFQRGTSKNPITAAQGRREFEGLINTTVKETEGTARQAAFDSIHKTMTPGGVTALPGDNEAKARTVMEYLQSKSSAPMALGYGIDLRQYPSTMPYKRPAQQASEGASLLGTRDANAGEKPQSAAGGFSLSEIRAELSRRKSGKGK